jgi:AraC-like DNA-binding protein
MDISPILVRVCAENDAPRAGAVISDGITIDTHWHVHDMHQILHAFEGALEVESGEACHLVPRQLAAWIPAGVAHRTHIHHVRSGSIFFSPGMIPAVSDRIRIVPVSALMREMMKEAMRWSITEVEHPIGRAYFEALALLCGEWFQSEECVPRLPTSDDPRIRKVMNYTRANLAAADLPSACRAAGLSERSLRRRFKDATAMTWEDYRRLCRLAEAIVLLGDTTLPVGAVAARVGFESQGAFAKSFRAFTGEGPRDYRRRIQANA